MKLHGKPLFALATLAIASTAFTGVSYANEAMREQLKTNFLQADVNEDGALTLDEFTTLINLNADHGIGRARMVKRFGKYETAFGRLDKNADGIVSTDELAAMAEKAGSQ